MDFQHCFFRSWKHGSMSEKISQKLCSFIFTKLSQNMCFINKHVLMYWHIRCDWWYRTTYDFKHIIIDYHSFWNVISLPNFHILSVLSIHTFYYIENFILENFHTYNWRSFLCKMLYTQLSQIVCLNNK